MRISNQTGSLTTWAGENGTGGWGSAIRHCSQQTGSLTSLVWENIPRTQGSNWVSKQKWWQYSRIIYKLSNKNTIRPSERDYYIHTYKSLTFWDQVNTIRQSAEGVTILTSILTTWECICYKIVSMLLYLWRWYHLLAEESTSIFQFMCQNITTTYQLDKDTDSSANIKWYYKITCTFYENKFSKGHHLTLYFQ